MARDGGSTRKKGKTATKTATKAAPSNDSKRSASRKIANFKSLEQSSRKHKRAADRQLVKRTYSGKSYEPGAKISDGTSADAYTAGGSIKFH